MKEWRLRTFILYLIQLYAILFFYDEYLLLLKFLKKLKEERKEGRKDGGKE